MKTKLSKAEHACLTYTQKYNKRHTWDFYCLAKDAYLAGYHQARADANNPKLGTEIEEYEVLPQIGSSNNSHD